MEDSLNDQKRQLSVSLGSVEDSFESLQSLCNDKSLELSMSSMLNDSESLEVVFWTEDIAELIGIATIFKNEAGKNVYSIDYSKSTL